jgi:hypothetical protein
MTWEEVEAGSANAPGRATGWFAQSAPVTHHHPPAMFSTVIRRATPSLRQARSYTAAAHTQAAASPSSKLDEGEQAIYDKLSDRFQTSELLVQDVSGAHHSHPLRIVRVSLLGVLMCDIA